MPHAYQLKKYLNTILVLAVVAIIAVGTLSALLLTHTQQDTRQQASVESGLVTLTTTTPTALQIGAPATIALALHTKDTQIDGIELEFDVQTTVTQTLALSVVESINLEITSQNITPIDGGFRVSLLALGKNDLPFSSNTATHFASLQFTPNQAGELKIIFNQDDSLATVFESSPVRDELKKIADVSFTVGAVSTSMPTPTPDTQATATPRPTPTPNDETEATPTPTPIPVEDDTATPNPTPTPDDYGYGGTSTASCNGYCSDSTECDINLMCYNSVCRLANNPSSESCAGPPDQGLSRGCDEYCADSRECGSGYTCHFNRCRLPQNITSTSCAIPVTYENPAANTYTGGYTQSRSTVTSYTQDVYEYPDPNTPQPLADTGGGAAYADPYSTQTPPDYQYIEITPAPIPPAPPEIFEPTSIEASPNPFIKEQDDVLDPFSMLPVVLGAGVGLILLIVIAAFFLIKKRAATTPIKIGTSTLEKEIPPPTAAPTKTSMSNFAGASQLPKLPDQRDDFKHDLK